MSNSIIDLDGLSGLGLVFANSTARISELWQERVKREIPEARDLTYPVLIDTLPLFLRYMAEALSPDFPRSLATETTTIAQEHGGERARLSNYRPQHILHEYHILKEVIFEVFEKDRVILGSDQLRVINASVDVAVRDSVTTFVLVQLNIREQYMATLTHDLRNPLSAISMAASLILKKPEMSAVSVLATRILDNSKRIDRMVQDLLDATAVSSGGQLQIIVTEFDLMELVQDVVSEMSVTYGDRFKITGEAILGFWGKDVLKRAIENLLTNAEKYGDPHKPISVKLTAKEERVIVSVHNHGNPIPPEEQEAIFQVFLRTQAARTGKKKGWGLGLALVRAAAEHHGGSIVVDSGVQRGTTFSFDIPTDSRPYLRSQNSTSV